MFGSDRNRPKDYRRAVVIDTGPKNMTNEDTLRSERRSTLKKRLTEPTLLEMSGNPTNRELAGRRLLHGGLSTGAKTRECIERIRQAVTERGRYSKEARLEREHHRNLLQFCRETLADI